MKFSKSLIASIDVCEVSYNRKVAPFAFSCLMFLRAKHVETLYATLLAMIILGLGIDPKMNLSINSSAVHDIAYTI